MGNKNKVFNNVKLLFAGRLTALFCERVGVGGYYEQVGLWKGLPEQ